MSIIILENGLRRTAKRSKAVPETQTVSDSETKTETETKGVYKYSCVMLPASDEVASIAKYWTRKNVPVDSLYVNAEEGMDGYESEPHVTVKYGLESNDVDQMRELIEGFGSISVKFGDVELFKVNPKFDVLKVAVLSDKLHKLNEIVSKLPCDGDKFPEYKPHMTLAYVKKDSCDDLVPNDFFSELEDQIDSVIFATTDGSDNYIDL